MKQQEDGQGRLKERVSVLEESMQVQANRVAQAEIQLTETDGKIQSSILDQLEEIPRIKQNIQKMGTNLVSLHDQLQLIKNSKLSPESSNVHLAGKFGNWNGAQPRNHTDSTKGLNSRNASLSSVINDKGQQNTVPSSKSPVPKVEAIQVEVPTIQPGTGTKLQAKMQHPKVDEKTKVASNSSHQSNEESLASPAVDSAKTGGKGIKLECHNAPSQLVCHPQGCPNGLVCWSKGLVAERTLTCVDGTQFWWCPPVHLTSRTECLNWHIFYTINFWKVVTLSTRGSWRNICLTAVNSTL